MSFLCDQGYNDEFGFGGGGPLRNYGTTVKVSENIRAWVCNVPDYGSENLPVSH